MCIKPLTIKSNGTAWSKPGSIVVPCGKCIECKIQYQNSWYIRLLEESKCHKHLIFFTLTYAESSVPFYVEKSTGQIYRTVLQDHIQKWIKRFRINRQRRLIENGCSKDLAAEKNKFKYWITSEYGPSTYRPHYHGLIFGLTKEDTYPLFNDWRTTFGFVNVKYIPLTDQKHRDIVLRYVTKYCSKGEFECPYVEHGKVKKTFHLISKKLGYEYINRLKSWHLHSNANKYDCHYCYTSDYLDDILQKRNYVHNGFTYKLPRYYCEKIFGVQSRLQAALSNHIRKKLDDAFIQQLAVIQSQRDCTEAQALNIYTNLQNEIHSRRYLQAKKRYEAFLNKSKL